MLGCHRTNGGAQWPSISSRRIESDLRLRGAKPGSITNYLRVATRWRTWCEENGLDPMSARKADVQAWLLSTGWAPSTMRQVGLVSLSAAYSFAVDDLEVIDRNPCRKVRLPKPIQRVIRTVPNRVLREIKAHVRDDYDLLLFCLLAVYRLSHRRGSRPYLGQGIPRR